MNRETCETLILQKLKEIKAIAKQYDKSPNFYLSVSMCQGTIDVNNKYWETETPLDVIEYADGRILRL